MFILIDVYYYNGKQIQSEKFEAALACDSPSSHDIQHLTFVLAEFFSNGSMLLLSLKNFQ